MRRRNRFPKPPTYRTSRWRVTWRGEEVRNPVARKLITLWAVVWAAVLIPFTFAMLIVIIPLSLPWHFLLRAVGHPGFVSREGSKVNYNVPWWGVLLALAPVAALILL